MRCCDVEERIEAWLDGELAPQESGSLARHLAECPACAASVAWAEAVRDGLRRLPRFEAPPALLAEIKAVARTAGSADGGKAVRGRRGRRIERPAAALGLLAATLALALGLAYRVGPSAPHGERRVARVERPAQPATAAEVERAEREVRLALALVGRYTRRAGAEVQRKLADAAVGGTTLRGLERALVPLAPLGGRSAEGRTDGGPPSA